jgi:hypothetical protein
MIVIAVCAVVLALISDRITAAMRIRIDERLRMAANYRAGYSEVGRIRREYHPDSILPDEASYPGYAVDRVLCGACFGVNVLDRIR